MKNIEDKIIEFTKRRFPVDCHWLDGNCYYFALILKDRFKNGKVYYDVINGHFVFEYGNKYYDWTGCINPDGYLVSWEEFEQYDSNRKKIIIRDCIN